MSQIFPRPWSCWGLLIAAAVFAAAGSAHDAAAQPPPLLRLESIQRIDVPDEHPKDWPYRDQQWLPMSRDEFERRLSRLLTPAEDPARPQWKHARYSAALVGDTLAMGRLQAELRRNVDSFRFLGLGNPSLAIEELTWDGRPAIWGTGLDRRHWLKLEPDCRRLEGRWSARGRVLETGVTFELELLPAALSELELQVPFGQVVTSNVGDVELVAAGSEDIPARWRI
ncbi:MAG TPA: hypothetical protein VM165_12090, partial [Planctomycetaceae bacterium]|nr:hypothetical protein [Planctomycetaceae bacterium]